MDHQLATISLITVLSLISFFFPSAPSINEDSPELESANSYSNSGIEQQVMYKLFIKL